MKQLKHFYIGMLISILMVGVTKTQSVEMVKVEGGTFLMGCTAKRIDDCLDNEKPPSTVTISSFYISKYEVTQKLYREVMGTNPSEFKGDNLPVEKVNWYDAIKFCNLLSEKDGLTPVYTITGSSISANWNANGYRLPTEAEWEYAADGGNKGRGSSKYSGGGIARNVGWYFENSGEKTQPVGTKKPNQLGIYDMSGNVWEWCWDWLGNYSSDSKTDPKGPSSGGSRVRRGGSWNENSAGLRTAFRGFDDLSPSDTRNDLGFRVVRTAQ